MCRYMKMIVGRALVLLVAAVVCSVNGQDNCLRYGGGSCCPQVNVLDSAIVEVIPTEPVYVSFLPRNEDSINIDNICFTFFPMPDDSNTYLLYGSRVYNNGFNEVVSLILSQPEPGVHRLGRGLCQFVDIVFASVECENPVYLNRRCNTYGDCAVEDIYESISGVYGFSNVRQPISTSCLNSAKAAIRINGIPENDFYILPMRLPSRCVLNQVCNVESALQRFTNTAGVAIP